MRSRVRGLPRRSADLHRAGGCRDRHGLLDDDRRALLERPGHRLAARRQNPAVDGSAVLGAARCLCAPEQPAGGGRDPDAAAADRRHPPLEGHHLRRPGAGGVRWRQLRAVRDDARDPLRQLHRRDRRVHRRPVAGTQLHVEVRRHVDEHDRVRRLRQYHRAARAQLPRLRHRSGTELSARRGLPQPCRRRLRCRAVPDRRRDVPHYRRRAPRRDAARGRPGRAGQADHRRNRIPQPAASDGRVPTWT